MTLSQVSLVSAICLIPNRRFYLDGGRGTRRIVTGLHVCDIGRVSSLTIPSAYFYQNYRHLPHQLRQRAPTGDTIITSDAWSIRRVGSATHTAVSDYKSRTASVVCSWPSSQINSDQLRDSTELAHLQDRCLGPDLRRCREHPPQSAWGSPKTSVVWMAYEIS